MTSNPIKKAYRYFNNQKKIFCIGFNKTGTTSLHNFFIDCGLKSSHTYKWVYYSYNSEGFYSLKKYQCFSDGECSNYRNLEKWFSNSIFIYNYRKEEDWLKSRIKHCLRDNSFGKIHDENIVSKKHSAPLIRDFVFGGQAALVKWLIEKRTYEAAIREYFYRRKNYLEINVINDNQWQEKVEKFIISNGFAIDPTGKIIHENRSENHSLKSKEEFEHYSEFIEKAIKIVDQLWVENENR